MKIAVLANDKQWEEMQPFISAAWTRLINEEEFFANTDAAVYMNLSGNAAEKDYSSVTKPVIINSVSTTLAETNAAANVVRVNGWLTFLKRDVWEVAGEINETLKSFFNSINKRIINVPDETGLVSARVVAMIINEGYFALQDEVSSKKEIDTAMKLGTNYPYGPFEWAEKIGLNNIAILLQQLSTKDKRYTAASLLVQESRN